MLDGTVSSYAGGEGGTFISNDKHAVSSRRQGSFVSSNLTKTTPPLQVIKASKIGLRRPLENISRKSQNDPNWIFVDLDISSESYFSSQKKVALSL